MVRVSFRASAIFAATLSAASVPALADDVVFRGNKTIPAGQTLEKDVTIIDGTLTVRGTIEGNVRQKGVGSVIVDGGLIKGNIDESEGGVVTIESEGVVEGNIQEEDNGSVEVLGDSLVKGNIWERNAGVVRISGSLVEGNIYEFDFGNLSIVADSLIKGNVRERDKGKIVLSQDSEVEGDVNED